MTSNYKPKNKHVANSYLSESKFRELSRLFRADAVATSAANPIGINRNATNRYRTMLRTRIAEICEAESPLGGEAEADESYFGPRRVRGVRGRAARQSSSGFSREAERSAPR